MLYELKYVSTHGVYKLHTAIGYFLSDGLNRTKFGEECFPSWFRPVLSASPSLRSKASSIHRKARRSNKGIRDAIHRVWISQNQVQKLCSTPSLKLEDWGFKNERLIKELKGLFSYLYENTLESKSFEKAGGNSLKDHYNKFRNLDQRVCPFCGLCYYEDRESKTRSAYDHWLARTHYPLAAVNFQNLVPMCDSCNKRPRKGTKNILFQSADPSKRQSFYYPYNKICGIKIEVTCLTKPNPSNPRGKWSVKTTASTVVEEPLVKAWDAVFDIETRFSARIMEGLDGWMKDFLNVKDYRTTPTLPTLREDLSTRAAWLAMPNQLKKRAESALESAAFSYLAAEASDPVLAGYARISTSPAIQEIPTVLGKNRN